MSDDDQTQKLLNLKELELKMSYVMPFTFDAVDWCVVTINEKPWTRSREVRRAPEYSKATKTADIVRHLCSKKNYAHKWQLTGLVSGTKPVDWPLDSQKYNIYTNEEKMYKIVFSNQQPKVKEFRRHCCNVLFPRVPQQLTNKMKEGHQPANEEKDAVIALLNDDQQSREYKNVALQVQKDVYQAQLERY